MAVYTPITDQEVTAFLAEYAIGTLVSCQGITEGIENSNFLLKTTTGTYILTLFEQRVDAQELPFYVELMRHMAENGFAVPHPVADKAGTSVHTLAGKPALIVTFLSGKAVQGADSITPAHLDQLGQVTAHMHCLPMPQGLARKNALTLDGWHSLWQKTLSRKEDIAPDIYTLVESELAYLTTYWPTHASHPTLPTGIIHADLFPDNVFYKQAILSGIIDFYFACNDFYAYELAIIINAWCFNTRHEYIPERLQALLRGYMQKRPLNGDEVEYLPLLCRGAALRFLLTRVHDALFTVKDAQVVIKDPAEYVHKLKFFQTIRSLL